LVKRLDEVLEEQEVSEEREAARRRPKWGWHGSHRLEETRRG
jgi:hypothetical protein